MRTNVIISGITSRIIGSNGYGKIIRWIIITCDFDVDIDGKVGVKIVTRTRKGIAIRIYHRIKIRKWVGDRKYEGKAQAELQVEATLKS